MADEGGERERCKTRRRPPRRLGGVWRPWRHKFRGGGWHDSRRKSGWRVWYSRSRAGRRTRAKRRRERCASSRSERPRRRGAESGASASPHRRQVEQGERARAGRAPQGERPHVGGCFIIYIFVFALLYAGRRCGEQSTEVTHTLHRDSVAIMHVSSASVGCPHQAEQVAPIYDHVCIMKSSENQALVVW